MYCVRVTVCVCVCVQYDHISTNVTLDEAANISNLRVFWEMQPGRGRAFKNPFDQVNPVSGPVNPSLPSAHAHNISVNDPFIEAIPPCSIVVGLAAASCRFAIGFCSSCKLALFVQCSRVDLISSC